MKYVSPDAEVLWDEYSLWESSDRWESDIDPDDGNA